MFALLLLGGCTRLPPMRLDTERTKPANAAIARDAGSATIDVLTFNIEGLGWPARKGRQAQLQQIGATLAALNARGQAPDVVLVQEMFSPAAVRAIDAGGYRYRAWGPSRTQRRRLRSKTRMPGPFRWKKGEVGVHLVGSGLAVLSRYPIVAARSEPFGSRHCAGLDCLSNKGVQHVRIRVPGVPEPVEIFNAHLNSRSAARVPAERSAAAHAMQVGDVAAFIGSVAPAGPVILGGDFNMRGDAGRLARFDAALGQLTLVQRYCVVARNGCDVRVSWDGDEPWMDTEDLQLFASGGAVRITPTRVEAMFDGAEGSPHLSDHDGFRVTYRLDWGAVR
ncbi:Metal-dependent hydrolase, endonuclease/exonuclease/phosphatase family [Sphingomonas palmae]|uniref:Metal-dependent hydrolase, endonuclease/exonuclease/phosphatase family n=1 Tax=Sphingomonas palmae TaxID=1855283 RepID=A0A1H7M9F9_9SPHN|nr:endonuclease/exonuclease/phosphatase family protein [Sphingomonas palmae]SEL07385.1 Metal-dependent hydrolase, endonuclease/exonuclease/phosphatase family [Sphingomonas palmae]